MNLTCFFSRSFLGLLLAASFLEAQEDKSSEAFGYLHTHEPGKALGLVADLSEQGPLSIRWQEIKALGLYQAGHYEEAIDAFLELGKRSPESLEARLPELAYSYLLSAQPSMAEPLFQKIQETADLNRFRGMLARLLSGKGVEVEAALARMEEGLPKSFSQTATLYLLDKKDEAKALLLSAIKDQPEPLVKPYLQTLRDLGWAKDVETAPAMATAALP